MNDPLPVNELPTGYRWATPDEVEVWLSGKQPEGWQWIGPNGHQDLAVPATDYTYGPEDEPAQMPQKRYYVELSESTSYRLYVDIDADASQEDVHQQAIDDHLDGLSEEIEASGLDVDLIHEVVQSEH